MRSAGTRLSEVVRVLDLRDDREDDASRRLAARRRSGGPREEAEHCGERENSSGCRPVAAHRLRFGPKWRTLASLTECVVRPRTLSRVRADEDRRPREAR